MRGLLLYNPLAGRRRDERLAIVGQIATMLHCVGYELEIAATTHRGSAGAQVREAIAGGAEVVFACGGDGTVHDALQGVVGSSAALAVIPLGSANALARELKIPLDPLVAAHAFAHADTMPARVGYCTAGGETHAFLVMAGAGPDGALMYRMLAVSRSRWGRWAYAAHAVLLLFRRRFASFTVRYRDAAGGWHETQAVSAMCMRVGTLGGVFPGVARGASLWAGSMKLVAVRGTAWVGLPLWFAMNWLGIERWNPLLVQADVVALECDGARESVHAQLDGEWIGRLPVSITLSGDAVQLLVPAGR
jgi:diacylglycerol kinase family enzyme